MPGCGDCSAHATRLVGSWLHRSRSNNSAWDDSANSLFVQTPASSGLLPNGHIHALSGSLARSDDSAFLSSCISTVMISSPALVNSVCSTFTSRYVQWYADLGFWHPVFLFFPRLLPILPYPHIWGAPREFPENHRIFILDGMDEICYNQPMNSKHVLSTTTSTTTAMS